MWNRRFAVPLPEFYQRRIIFWYDEDKEFEDKLDEVVLENAKVVALTFRIEIGTIIFHLLSHGRIRCKSHLIHPNRNQICPELLAVKLYKKKSKMAYYKEKIGGAAWIPTK